MDRILHELPVARFKDITKEIGALRAELSHLGVAARIQHNGNRYDRDTGGWLAMLEIEVHPRPGYSVVSARLATKLRL